MWAIGLFSVMAVLIMAFVAKGWHEALLAVVLLFSVPLHACSLEINKRFERRENRTFLKQHRHNEIDRYAVEQRNRKP